MQFKVPQFIELEDKIVGPLTIKQFLYLAGSAGLLFFVWIFFTLVAFIIIAIPVIIIAVVFAFYKPHGRPFITLVGSFIKYLTKPRLYLWKRKND